MYNVVGSMLGGQYSTANVHEGDRDCTVSNYHAYYEALYLGIDDVDDETRISTSTMSHDTFNPQSEESDETGTQRSWKSSTVAKAEIPLQCQPDKLHNNITEQSLQSLGYKAFEDWPSLATTVESNKEDLYFLLSELVRENRNTNAMIIIGKSSVDVHLIVLQCFSGLFCDMGTNTVNVDLPSDWVTPRSFHLIYEWMIEDSPLLSRLGLLEVLRAANFLNMPQLEKQCEHCLTCGITEESAVMLYLEARLLRMEGAHRSLLQRVGRFFLTLVASQEFLQLPMHALWTLLNCNNVGVNSELEVFMSAVRWLNFQWPKRRLIVSQVISCVRFALVPPWLLIQLHDHQTKYVELKRIVSQPEVLQQLHDGIGYTTTRLCYGQDREAFKLHLERTGIRPPEQRNWIYDRKCGYHHRLNCHISKEFSYEAFLSYLSWLQTQPKNYWQSFEAVNESETCVCCHSSSKISSDKIEI